jgi:hypothetical protein
VREPGAVNHPHEISLNFRIAGGLFLAVFRPAAASADKPSKLPTALLPRPGLRVQIQRARGHRRLPNFNKVSIRVTHVTPQFPRMHFGLRNESCTPFAQHPIRRECPMPAHLLIMYPHPKDVKEFDRAYREEHLPYAAPRLRHRSVPAARRRLWSSLMMPCTNRKPSAGS